MVPCHQSRAQHQTVCHACLAIWLVAQLLLMSGCGPLSPVVIGGQPCGLSLPAETSEFVPLMKLPMALGVSHPTWQLCLMNIQPLLEGPGGGEELDKEKGATTGLFRCAQHHSCKHIQQNAWKSKHPEHRKIMSLLGTRVVLDENWNHHHLWLVAHVGLFRVDGTLTLKQWVSHLSSEFLLYTSSPYQIDTMHTEDKTRRTACHGMAWHELSPAQCRWCEWQAQWQQQG